MAATVVESRDVFSRRPRRVENSVLRLRALRDSTSAIPASNAKDELKAETRLPNIAEMREAIVKKAIES